MYGQKIPVVAVVAAAPVATLANTGASIGWMLFGGVALVVAGLMLRVVVLRRPADRK